MASFKHLSFRPELLFLLQQGDSLPRPTLAKHVIPRWPQSRFALRDETPTRLDVTRFHIREFTIPCFQCDSKHVEPWETQVENVVLREPDAAEVLGKGVLFPLVLRVLTSMTRRAFLRSSVSTFSYRSSIQAGISDILSFILVVVSRQRAGPAVRRLSRYQREYAVYLALM